MNFIEFCEQRGYDPGMDMTRETRIKLAEAYAEQQNRELRNPWHKENPEREGSYIVRSATGFIKMAQWNSSNWKEMLQNTMIAEVIEWMHIPYNE